MRKFIDELMDLLSEKEIIIEEQGDIINELMIENTKYKSLYEKHRDETDADCWGC